MELTNIRCESAGKHLLAVADVDTEHGLLKVEGGFEPHHIYITGVLTVNRVDYNISVKLLRYPDGSLNFLPSDYLLVPNRYESVRYRRVDTGDTPTQSAYVKIDALIEQVKACITDHFMKLVDFAYLSSRVDALDKEIEELLLTAGRKSTYYHKLNNRLLQLREELNDYV